MTWLWIGAGGALGTVARYGLGRGVHLWAGTAFPWGTLLVNIVGCLALGMVVRVGEASTMSPEVRGMLTVGFCGGFTTFSTFGYETVVLLQEGQGGRALAYVLASVVVGIAALWAGLHLGGLMLRTGG